MSETNANWPNVEATRSAKTAIAALSPFQTIGAIRLDALQENSAPMADVSESAPSSASGATTVWMGDASLSTAEFLDSSPLITFDLSLSL